MDEEVLEDGQLAVEARRLEDDAEAAAQLAQGAVGREAVDAERSFGRGDQRREELEEGRLAAAVRAEEGEELARRDVEGDAVEGEAVAVGPAQPLDRDEGRGAHPPATRSARRRTTIAGSHAMEARNIDFAAWSVVSRKKRIGRPREPGREEERAGGVDEARGPEERRQDADRDEQEAEREGVARGAAARRVDGREDPEAGRAVVRAVPPADGVEVRHLPEEEDGEEGEAGRADRPRGGRVAAERREGAGDGADDRREGRAGLHRRVDEDVARQRERRQERGDAVREEPELADAEDARGRGRRRPPRRSGRRPAGRGRVAVRAIRRSRSISAISLNALVPEATRAVPRSVWRRRTASRPASGPSVPAAKPRKAVRTTKTVMRGFVSSRRSGQVRLHAGAGAASPAGAPAVAGAVVSAFMRARRTAARTPVIQRRPPTARWAEVIATAFAVQTDVAPSVTCAATRTSQSVESVPKPETPRTFRSESAAATTRATTTQANVRWVKWARTPFGGPVGARRDDLAEGERPVGDGEPRARVADDRAEEDLDVARPGGPEREAAGLRQSWPGRRRRGAPAP